MRYRIINGRLLDPATQRDEIADLLVEDGRIVEALTGAPDRVLDAAHCWVVPGLIDAHVHLREPGGEAKETIETGLRAAAAGGFTTVMAMPNTAPPIDTVALAQWVVARAEALGGTRVIPVPAITVGRQGEQLVDFAAFVAQGFRVFTDDGTGVNDDALMRRALELSAEHDFILSQHAEVAALSQGGFVHRGDVSQALGIPGQPAASEVEMVQRDLDLAAQTGGRIHVSHISAAPAVAALRHARQRGVRATAEVTPHHLHLTDAALQTAGTLAKVAPPLRPQEHVDACREALRDGTIDMVATDHAPHTRADKPNDFSQAAFGMVGLEIAVPLLLSLVAQNTISPMRMVEAMSHAPARVFGLDGGTLAPGAPADIALIHPNQPHAIDPTTFRSKGTNTPFAGTAVPGRTVLTIARGRIIFEANAHDAAPH
ncbi:MAG: dihydroorotase [Myxococcales bacterium]|jgi:dihydroorotase|nr:dihydroorotase [Myxococcales bacterium]